MLHRFRTTAANFGQLLYSAQRGTTDCSVPRFSDTPKIEIVLLDHKDQPSVGGSETPIVTIAPAVGNAIFAASGVRLRSLPMIPGGLRV